ncbi:MAG: acyl-CoA thioesterase [Leptospiraceae bacterium]|nr:acyl-CoA thioesterase [Leptospiraceae bacterium]
MNKEPESEARILFEHCDPFGHLNNMQYLSYMMTARTNHLRDEYNFDLFEHGKLTGNNWVVTRTRINYISPIKFNDIATFKTRLLFSDKNKVIPEVILYNSDKTKLHALAWIEFTYFNLSRAKPVRHEPDLCDFLSSIEYSLNDFHLEKIDSRTNEVYRSLIPKK